MLYTNKRAKWKFRRMNGLPEKKSKWMWVQEKERGLRKQFINGINDMTMKIRRELTTIKKTNQVTSEHILSCSKMSWRTKGQKAMIEATKESKEFDSVKRIDQQNNGWGNTKRKRKIYKPLLILWYLYTSHTNVLYTARVVLDVAKLTTLIRCAGTQAEIWKGNSNREKCRKVHNMCQDAEKTGVSRRVQHGKIKDL